MKRANFLCVKIVTAIPELYTIKKLVKAFEKRGHSPQIINPYKQSFDLSKPFDANEEDKTIVLHRITGTSLDDIDLLYCFDQQKRGATVINDPYQSSRLRDKASQQLLLNWLDLPSIPSLAIRGEINIPQWSEGPYFKDEWVLKTFRGNKGKGVSLIRGHDSLTSVWETLSALGDERFIIQPRLKVDREWRVLITPKFIGALLKEIKTTEDFRHNASRINASFVAKEKMPKNILELAETVISKVPLAIMGLDIIESEGQLFVCEINPVPGFELFDKISVLDIAQIIVDSIINP